MRCPASVSQRLLWMATHRSGAGATVTPRQYLIRDLDSDALTRSLADLIVRHEALRTRFSGAGARLVQEILEPAPLSLDWIPCADASLAQGGVTADGIRTAADGPVKVRGLRGARDALLLLDIDHLLTDVWSYDVILGELDALYQAYTSGQPPVLPDVGWQYRQFAEWQVGRLRGATLEKYQDAWLRKLSGAAPPGLPSPASRPPRRERLAGVQWLADDLAPHGQDVADALRTLSTCGPGTVSAAALAVFFLQLALITGQDDITVSSIFANRTNRNCWRTVGLFAHLIPLRISISRRDTVRTLVRTAHGIMLHAMVNQELPMSLLPTGSLDRTVFKSINNIVFHVLPPAQARRQGGGRGSIGAVNRVPEGTKARFDLELQLAPQMHGLRGFVRYATDRFAPQWVAAFRAAFCDLIMIAAADPDRRLHEIAAVHGSRLKELGSV